METHLGQAAPLVMATETIPSRLLPCCWDGSGCWWTLWGPLTLRHTQKSLSFRALASEGPLFMRTAPEGSWYPYSCPMEFFLGGSKVPAVVAGPRGLRPRPQIPPAMASWAPCTAMSSVCLFRSGGPVLLMYLCLSWGASRVPTPLPGSTVTARDAPSGRGELCQSCVVWVVCFPPTCVHIWLVSCPC